MYKPFGTYFLQFRLKLENDLVALVVGLLYLKTQSCLINRIMVQEILNTNMILKAIDMLNFEYNHFPVRNLTFLFHKIL